MHFFFWVTEPMPPGNLVIKSSQESDGKVTVVLGWTRPSFGNVENYELCYGEEGGWQKTQKTQKNSDKTEADISGLTPGLPYSYEIVAIANEVRSDPFTLTQPTGSGPRALFVFLFNHFYNKLINIIILSYDFKTKLF